MGPIGDAAREVTATLRAASLVLHRPEALLARVRKEWPARVGETASRGCRQHFVAAFNSAPSLHFSLCCYTR